MYFKEITDWGVELTAKLFIKAEICKALCLVLCDNNNRRASATQYHVMHTLLGRKEVTEKHLTRDRDF